MRTRNKETKYTDCMFTKELVNLMNREKLTTKDIAEIAEIPLATIKTWLYCVPPRKWARPVILHWISISVAHEKRN